MQMNKPRQPKRTDVTKTPGFQMLPPELQNVAVSAAEAKYQAQVAADNSKPPGERFNAAREFANNVRYVKGNSTNYRNRMGFGKNTQINTDPESYRTPNNQGPRDRVRPRTPFPKLPNFGSDAPTGGSSGGSANGNNSYNSFEQIYGYAVINDSNSPTTFSTPIDTSLYENPYAFQAKPDPDKAITARTVVNVIQPLFMDTSADTILQELYAGWKMEVNSNTNGGNQVTDTKFTYTNVKNYLKDVWSGLFYLVELMSRQAWATEDINSNKVLRNQAYFLTSDPAMLTIRNYMASTLSNFVIPQGMYDYAYWLFQVYQTNTFKNAVDQVFVSSTFATYIYGVTDDASALSGYKASLTSAVNPLKNNIELYSQISALLQSKTSCRWVNCRYIRKPSNTTHFDPAFNDIFNNQAFIGKYKLKNGTYTNSYLPSVVEEPATVPVVFSTDITKVQCHVMETFLEKYNKRPLLYSHAACGIISLGHQDFEGFNKFVLFQDGSNRKFAAIQRKEFFNQVGSDALKIKVNVNGDALDEDWVIMPIGSQHYLYDVAYPACILAQRMVAAKLFA